jgi:hypothetical protein
MLCDRILENPQFMINNIYHKVKHNLLTYIINLK